jgi:hypothetical protein
LFAVDVSDEFLKRFSPSPKTILVSANMIF